MLFHVSGHCLELFLSPLILAPGHRGHLLFPSLPSDTPGHLSPCDTAWLHVRTDTESLSGLATFLGSNSTCPVSPPEAESTPGHTCHPETSWHLVLAGWVGTKELQAKVSQLPPPTELAVSWSCLLTTAWACGFGLEPQSVSIMASWAAGHSAVLCMSPCWAWSFPDLLVLQDYSGLSLCSSVL